MTTHSSFSFVSLKAALAQWLLKRRRRKTLLQLNLRQLKDAGLEPVAREERLF